MLKSLAIALLPAAILIGFIYWKDKYEKEPTKWIWKGFWYGILSALASFAISMPFQSMGLFTNELLTVGDSIRTAFFGAAIPEEGAKLLLLWLLLRKNPYFDEYVDGMVYAVCVGMGFAALENVGYMLGNYEEWNTVGLMRGLISVPAHFFFAIAMGYFYSLAQFGDKGRRITFWILALAVPVLLHGGFDALLMASEVGGGAGACLAFFFALFFYMARSSKKRFNEHLKRDEQLRDKPEPPTL